MFEVGIYDYDKAFVIMPMEDAQKLLMLGDQVGMVEIQTNNPDKVQQIVAPLQPLVGRSGVITDWRQMNSALFSALDLERVVMFIVVSIIVLVAAFNIASSLIMLVRVEDPRHRDPADDGRDAGAAMLRIFMTVGMTIGTVGILDRAHARHDRPAVPSGRGEPGPVR